MYKRQSNEKTTDKHKQKKTEYVKGEEYPKCIPLH